MALTDQEIEDAAPANREHEHWFKLGARWAEAAATAPLLARIEYFEKLNSELCATHNRMVVQSARDAERIAALTAQVEQAAQPVADPFTYVIQHLNSNPYALSKDECIEKIKELRALYTAPPKAVPLTEAQREVLAYLDGIGPLDGIWFGDKHPTEQGSYWWRKRLWAAFGTPATVEKG